MDALETANALTDPIGAVGSWFYFSPPTVARAEGLGITAFELYALGRGGVLSDPSPQHVEDTFHFFKQGVIAGLIESATRVISVDRAVDEHLASADAFALATFGGIAPPALEAMVEATVTLAHTLPEGRWPLYDGYRFHGLPGGVQADAYRCSIWLRELRGGVHTEAVMDAGLTAVEACYLEASPRSFALHGFTDADVPVVDDALRVRRAAAEVDTSVRMAGLLTVLAPEQRRALVDAATEMKPALKAPVPVS